VKPPVELRVCDDGVAEIWRDGVLIGAIEPSPEGLRIVLGDADPGGGLSIVWGGDPISLRLDLVSHVGERP
jgi:hypothetical protein